MIKSSEKWEEMQEAKKKSEELNAMIRGTWFEEQEISRRSEQNKRKRQIDNFYSIVVWLIIVMIATLLAYNILIN